MTGKSEAAGSGVSAGHGLRPRPGPDPAVVALVAAAVEEVWPRPVVVEVAQRPSHRSWRFSGRWWSRPLPARRERPWVG